jgi:hypothetical protein
MVLKEFADSQKYYGANDYPPVPTLKKVNISEKMDLMDLD